MRKFLTADAVAASNSIEGFRVSTQDVRDLMDGERDVDVSDEAQRDLRDLATAGLLVPVGRTRARYYTEGSRFPAAALERARTPFTLTSPYPDE